jgi:uncharacterized membrane protein YkoI
MIRSTFIATCLVFPLLAGPALADDGLCRTGITAEEAIRIARDAGVARVQEVDCDDNRWEVEGRDAQGRKIEVEVHARDGRVIEVDREGR